MTIQFIQQTIAKIISIIAALIIAVGIVKMPVAVDYEAPRHKSTEKEILREIAETPEQPQIPLPKSKSASETEAKKEFSQPAAPEGDGPRLENSGRETPTPTISLTELNTQTRKTIVNILCVTKAGGSFKPITGSGVVISPKGVILTNAHIGQYLLLEGEPSASYLDCIIRTGDIASPAYNAKLLYIPSIWVEKNAENIIQQEPKGTGENDYALLFITESIVQGKELPPDFASTEPNFDFENLPANLSVLLASYPAGFIGGIEVQKNLGLTSTFAPIKSLYAFSETGPTTLDLFSLGGNIIAQGGSSGGGVFDTRDGKLLGIIVTSTEATTTAGRILNVIAIPHIKRSFEKYTGKNLASFLDNPSTVKIFPASEFTRLKNLLVEQLNKR